ncbi:MAG: nuclear transport factor 2 family protein [Burkholderiaceae bacterium]
MDFDALLSRFAQVVHAHDSAGLAALFTPDGVYDDYFFGAHAGADAIAAMLDRFHVGGEDFCWEWIEPVHAGDIGYASYCFSYRSREPDSAGRLIVFEGMARIRLRDGLIAHYAEVFDRGVAFTQLGYPGARTVKLLERYAKGFGTGATAERHRALRTARGLAV